uniref:Uncharacterized protein n=1 Tax=Oryzias sinensis TaxID=183150 RepID=A0A8C8E196_9TELE
MATGANATPLGKLHPSIGAKRGFDAGPGAGNGLMPAPGPTASFAAMPGFQPALPSAPFAQFNPVGNFQTPAPQPAAGSGMNFGKKRKKSRWSSETPDQKTIIPGMPTVIPPGLTRDQERAYIGKCCFIQLRLPFNAINLSCLMTNDYNMLKRWILFKWCCCVL